MFETYDTMMLDDTLLYNKIRHKSPIVYLPEIMIYDYTFDDIVECGHNYKDNEFAACHNGLLNTLDYYVNSIGGKANQSYIDKLLGILKEFNYSIFHIDNKTGNIYLVSLNPKYHDTDKEICIDAFTPQCLKNGAYSGIVMDDWNGSNITMSFEKFKCVIYDKIHNDDLCTKELGDLINSNGDYKERVSMRPYFANEEVEFDNEYNDFVLDGLLSPATEAKKTKSPAEKVADGLSSLEKMSDDGDDTESGSTSIDNTKETRERDNKVIDAAKATSDKLEEDGQDSMDEMGDETDAQGESDVSPEEDSSDDSSTDDGMDEDESDMDDDSDDMSDEEDPDNMINDPKSKQRYHLKMKKLYKHINDVIDTLETFTPAYNSDFVSDYYEIQHNFARLRSAIFKICTETIDDMDVLDLMKKYGSANMAYDALIEMFKEFMGKYKKERERAKKSSKNND